MNLGPFELVTQLGQGGMAEVWLGRHPAHPTEVAIKVQRITAPGEQAQTARFLAEVRAVAAMHHAHIVSVLDYGSAPGLAWFAMPRAEGTLRDALPTSWHETRELLLQLLSGLAHAHARGVIHRDLKPANVLRIEDRWVLADFGIALAVASPERGGFSGTPAYTAPEQIRATWREQGPFTDLYALGCLAWRLICGKSPFSASTPNETFAAHLAGTPHLFSPQFPVPAGLETWLRAMIQPSTMRRFRRAADAAWALQQLGPAPGPASTAQGSQARTNTLTNATWFEFEVNAPPAPEDEHPAILSSVPPLPPSWTYRSSSTPVLPALGLGLVGIREVAFVGRHHERDQLWEALLAVTRTPRAKHVLIEGPAGIGKSALANWLIRTAHEVGGAHPFTVLGTADSREHDGLLPSLRRWLVADGLHGDALAKRVRNGLHNHPAALIETVCAWLEDPLDIGPGRQRAIVHALFAHSERPAVVLLEDVSTSPESMALWGWLQDATLPVLVIGTARTEHLDSALREQLRPTLSLSLGPLTANTQLQLLASILDLAPELAYDIAELTREEPAQAQALITDLIERDALQAGPQGFQLRPEATLTETLSATLSARLQRALGEDSPVPVELAAALGAVVSRAELSAACAALSLADPTPLLERLQDAGLLELRAAAVRWRLPELRTLVEQSALAAGRWRTHHLFLAKQLAALPSRAGRHLMLGGKVDEGLAVLFSVIDAIESRSGGIDMLAEASVIERLMTELAIPSSDPRWGELFLFQAVAQRAQHNFRACQRALDKVSARLSHPGWAHLRFRAARVTAAQLAVKGDLAASLAVLLDLLPDLLDSGQTTDLARHHTLLAQLYRLIGDGPAALGAARQAADYYQGTSLRWEAAANRCTTADALRLVGKLSEAQDAYTEALNDLRAFPVSADYARALIGLGDLAMIAGQTDQARIHHSAARAIYTDLDNAAGVTSAANQLGEIARKEGRYAEAERHYHEAVRLAANRDPLNHAFALANLGLTQLAAGRWDDALVQLSAASDRAASEGRSVLSALFRTAALPAHCGRPTWAGELQFAEEALVSPALSDPDLLASLTLAHARSLELAPADAERCEALCLQQQARLTPPDTQSP